MPSSGNRDIFWTRYILDIVTKLLVFSPLDILHVTVHQALEGGGQRLGPASLLAGCQGWDAAPPAPGCCRGQGGDSDPAKGSINCHTELARFTFLILGNETQKIFIWLVLYEEKLKGTSVWLALHLSPCSSFSKEIRGNHSLCSSGKMTGNETSLFVAQCACSTP